MSLISLATGAAVADAQGGLGNEPGGRLAWRKNLVVGEPLRRARELLAVAGVVWSDTWHVAVTGVALREHIWQPMKLSASS